MKTTVYNGLFDTYYVDYIVSVLEEIRNGEYKNQVEEKRNMIASGPPGREKEAMKGLSWFTPSGVLDGTISANYLSEYSGLIALEITNINLKNDKEIIKKIESIPFTFCRFQNVDESSMTVLVKGEPKYYENDKVFIKVEKYYAEILGKQFNTHSISTSEPVYISYCPDLYLNLDCEQFNAMSECEVLIPDNVETIEISSDILNENWVTTTTTTLDIEAREIEKYLISGEKLLLEKTSTIPYLLEPIFPQSGIISIVGGSDTGKSSFLRQFATAIVHGDSDFLGFRLNQRFNRVIYLSTEDDQTMMSHLLAKQNPGNIAPQKFRFIEFIFDSSDYYKKIERVLQKYSIDCLIIDAFSDLLEGDINHSTNVRGFLNRFSLLVERYNILVIMLHHTAKRTEDLKPSKNNILGSQGFEAKMRLVIELKLDPNDPSVRQMWIVKGNYLSSEFKKSSFALKFDEESLRFTNLNKRESNITNSKKALKNKNDDIILKVKILALRSQGLSYRKIEASLNAEGIVIKKSKISNIIKDARPSEAGIVGFPFLVQFKSRQFFSS